MTGLLHLIQLVFVRILIDVLARFTGVVFALAMIVLAPFVIRYSARRFFTSNPFNNLFVTLFWFAAVGVGVLAFLSNAAIVASFLIKVVYAN